MLILLAPQATLRVPCVEVWKEGELGGRPAGTGTGTFRLPNTFGLPRSGASHTPPPYLNRGGGGV
eukprot:scaffold10598_cov138-Isochrysis_galbana.AAC.2